VCSSDLDIVERMKKCGNAHYKVQARVVHLWHQRLNFRNEEVDRRFKFNEHLFHSKINILKRNEGKNWGSL
jgi:hypothetical protein